jgi:hypothetical protein
VRSDDNRSIAFLALLLDEISKLFCVYQIHGVCRFVQKNYFWIMEKACDQLATLPLSKRQFALWRLQNVPYFRHLNKPLFLLKVSCIPTYVKKGASIGSSATLLCGITVGENAVVGAGSVVTKDVPPNTIVAGNPAKVLRRIKEN